MRAYKIFTSALVMSFLMACGQQTERNMGGEYTQEDYRNDVAETCVGMTDEERAACENMYGQGSSGGEYNPVADQANAQLDALLAAVADLNATVELLNDRIVDLETQGVDGDNGSGDGDVEGEEEVYNPFLNSLFAPTHGSNVDLATLKGILQTDYAITGNLSKAFEYWHEKTAKLDLVVLGSEVSVTDIFQIPFEEYDRDQELNRCDQPIVPLTVQTASIDRPGVDLSAYEEFQYTGQTSSNLENSVFGTTLCNRSDFPEKRTLGYRDEKDLASLFEHQRTAKHVDKIKKYDNDDRASLLDRILYPEKSLDSIEHGRIVTSAETGRALKYSYIRNLGSKKFAIFWLVQTNGLGGQKRWHHIKYVLDFDRSVKVNPVEYRRLTFTELSDGKFELIGGERLTRHHERTRGGIGRIFDRK